ncbi:hypothetical protein [Arthrobacter alpinus]|uniref:pullulanase X25 domain-containing protein n=1 Tax=Arthrobacter alpinus TaxID=656366 RepID=UPI0028F6DAAD|nr:hypothetical protein [Arthrobacter alpinus]
MTKGRSGWEITDDGLKATVAFVHVASLTAALANATPVPADTPLPAKPAARKPAVKKPSTKAAPRKPASKAPEGEPGVVLGDQPQSVALAGDFGTVLGALENWDPGHAGVQMVLDAHSGIWKLSAELPAGNYSYKAVANGSWDQNYGAFGFLDGANHEFTHDGGHVTFHYNHATKDVLRGA